MCRTVKLDGSLKDKPDGNQKVQEIEQKFTTLNDCATSIQHSLHDRGEFGLGLGRGSDHTEGMDKVQSSSKPSAGVRSSQPARPTSAPAKVAKPSSTATGGPQDKVTLSGEKAGATDRLSALQGGLQENYSVSDASEVAPAKPAAKESGPIDPGQASVDLARQFEGMLSQDVKGKLEPFGAAGGNTSNCADFVSSVLQASERGIERTPSVSELRAQLLEKGWEAIPREEARPGDVWMTESNTYGSRHTELVTTAGGTHTIGSNNISSTQQQIFEREKEGGIIYGHRPEAAAQQN